MYNKIKAWLIKAGWYTKSKFVRHTVGSMFLVFIFAGIFIWFVIPFATAWPLAGLVAWVLGLAKELYEWKIYGKFSGEDMNLNTMGVLLGIIPWLIRASLGIG